MSPCSNTFWFLLNSRIVFPNPTLARKTFASNSSLAGFPIGASFGSTNVINSRGLIEQRRRSQQGHCFRSLPKEINPGLPARFHRESTASLSASVRSAPGDVSPLPQEHLPQCHSD